MTPLEWLASGLGLLGVWLTVRQNPLCWPVGLVMVVLYAAFFFQAQLYSQVLLHVVFALMQIYGAWQWRRGLDERGIRPVSSAGSREMLAGLAGALLIGVALGAAMAAFTDAEYPHVDALLTAFSLLAQLWMALKRWQCWVLWLVLDVLYVIFFAALGYLPTAVLYALFCLLAVAGLRSWRISLRQQEALA